MADMLRKILALTLLIIIGVIGTATANDNCPASCHHHSQAVEASCCAKTLAADMGAANHDMVPVQTDTLCAMGKTALDAIAPSPPSQNTPVAAAVLPTLVVYAPRTPSQPLSVRQLPAPDLPIPVYKRHCVYLN